MPAIIGGGAFAPRIALAQARVQPQIQAGTAAWSPAPVVIRAQSNLVPLEVVVRSADGRVVTGLGQGRFQVFDDGHPRPLSQFFVNQVPGTAATPAAAAATEPGATAQPAPAATAAPSVRTIALWFDDVNTDGHDLEHARSAAERFLAHARDPGDRTGVFTASGIGDLAFTRDSAALSRAVAAIRAHPRQSPYGLRNSCPRITPFQAYQIVVLRLKAALDAAVAEKAACGTVTDELTGSAIPGLDSPANADIAGQADATWQMARTLGQDTLSKISGVVNTLAAQPGKRILLMASGGFLSETLGGIQQQIINQALHAKVVINALDARGLYTESPVRPLGQESDAGVLPLLTFFYEASSELNANEAEDDAMVDLAQSTGGLFFHNSNDLALGFRRLGLAPAVTYELAFAPASLPRDGKFHKLKVKLTPPIKGAVIQARRGYYDPEPLTPAEQLGPALAAAMRGKGQESHVPVSVQVKPESGSVGVHVQFDVGRLAFTSVHGRRNQLLDVIAALFDRNGQFVTGQQGTIDLALDGSHYRHFRKAGLGATLGLHAPAGIYRLRVAVAEASDGKLSTFARTVTIH